MVEGVVTDTATGLPVAGALVQITVNGLTLAVVTDAEGRYRVEVEPGAFAVAAVGEGYAAGGSSGTGTGGGTTVADVGLAPTGLPGIQNQVAILVPPEGTVTDFEQVTVVGTVLNPGSVVTVNGIAAEVRNRTFIATNVPTQPGMNAIVATASDAVGNQDNQTITVHRETFPGPRIAVFGGSGQSAPIGSTLAQPLVAQVTEDGVPLALVDLGLERGARDSDRIDERFWRSTLSVRVAGF